MTTRPEQSLIALLQGAWTLQILFALEGGPRRFNELKAAVGGVSNKMLAARLRELAEAGIVHRDYRPTIPPAVTYSLSQRGEALRPLLAAIRNTADAWEKAA